MSYSDYLPVGIEDDEEERLRRGEYAPAVPESAPPVAPPAEGYAPVTPTEIGSTADLESKIGGPPNPHAPAMGDVPKRSTWNDYEPAEPHGLAKFGHILAAINPTSDYIVNQMPQQRAEARYKAATGEFDKTEAQRVAAQKAASDEVLKEAEAKEHSGKNDITTDKNKNAHEIALRKLGLRPDAAGNAVPVPYEEMSIQEQAVHDLKVSQSEAAAAKAEMDQAKNDPTSPIFKQAAARLATAQQNARTSAGKLGLDVTKFNADYLGEAPGGTALPGATKDETGHPIGPKVANAAAHNDPTAQRANKADLAVNIQHNVEEAKRLIDREPLLFGKLAGHFTSLREMMGSNDANISSIGMVLHNAALANNSVHGIRSAEGAKATEAKILNSFRNGPEATKAALDEMVGSAHTFIESAQLGRKASGGHAERDFGPAPAGKAEGATGRLPDGTKVIVKNGKLVTQ